MSIEELYPGTGANGNSKPKIDVVAILGLNPWGKSDHAFNTFQSPAGHLWLRDALPLAQPNARTLLYEYNSSPAFGTDKGRFIHEANTLLECLTIKRRNDPKRPLILIGHSLGGTLIKQALVNAQANPRYSSTGLTFFGTPYAGPTEDAKVKFGRACVAIAQKIPRNPSNDVMEALKNGSLFSDILQENWRHQLGEYKIVSFYEGIGNLIPRDSAVIGLPGDIENQVKLVSTHSDMRRFDPSVDQDRKNYFFVEGSITELCTIALAKVIPLVEHEVDDMISSLFSSCHNPRFEEVVEGHDESFQWLWKKEMPNTGFIDWLAHGRGVFWINGKPGSGKSTLMKFAYSDARMSEILKESSPPAILGKFFFYDQGSTDERSFTGLLHYLLLILLRADLDLTKQISQIYKGAKWRAETNNTRIKWTQRELEMAIFCLSRHTQKSQKVIVFVDALDECQGDQRHYLDFLTNLVRPTESGGFQIQLCLSSRPDNAIQLRLEGFPGLSVQDLTRLDIANYISQKLGKAASFSASKEYTKETSQELVDSIVAKSSGVFLWVRLVVKELIEGIEDGDTDEELQKRLSELLPDLEDLYSRIVERIPSRYLQDTVHYFQIILNGPERFHLLLFCLAVDGHELAINCPAKLLAAKEIRAKCRGMERRLQTRCRSLLEAENSIIGLLHRSVKDWLLREDAFQVILSRTDVNLRKDFNIALMSLYFRQLKISRRQGKGESADALEDREGIQDYLSDIESGKTANEYTDLEIIQNCLMHARNAEITAGRA